MSPTKGYFSLIQYCPDIARREAANVGVVLFCPELHFLEAKLIRSNHRIRRFFGEEADNYQHLNAMKDSLANRLKVEKAEFKSLEHLQMFVATRANKVILTDPRPVKIFAPVADLEALYRELVIDPSKPLSVQAEIPLRKRLDQTLLAEGVRRFIQRDITVNVPALNECIEIPYAYKNGRLNLIKPVEFTQQSEARLKNAACKTAMEGLSLHRHADPQLGELQLIVVADFAAPKPGTRSLVEDIFREGSVQMFTPENLEELKLDIIRHGKIWSSSDLLP